MTTKAGECNHFNVQNIHLYQSEKEFVLFFWGKLTHNRFEWLWYDGTKLENDVYNK